MQRVRAIISGRVHGVGYRASVALEARRLAITGWVRNRPDGTVELEAEGPDGAIATLLAWCEHGPPTAHVINVAYEAVHATAADRGFSVR